MGFEEQRHYVNTEFGDATRGKSLTKSQKSRLLRLLWKKAKKMFP